MLPFGVDAVAEKVTRSVLFAFSSMVLPGVGRDAAYVAKRIAARSGAGRSLAAA